MFRILEEERRRKEMTEQKEKKLREEDLRLLEENKKKREEIQRYAFVFKIYKRNLFKKISQVEFFSTFYGLR